MKLLELKGVCKGTYIAFRLSSESSASIRKWSSDNGIKKYCTPKEERAHVTLIYSRNVIKDYKPSNDILTASFGGFSLFDFNDDKTKTVKKCLVMNIVCPELLKKHNTLRSVYNATHDFNTYEPHITITYDATDIDISSLKPFTDKIYLCDEYMEPLMDL